MNEDQKTKKNKQFHKLMLISRKYHFLDIFIVVVQYYLGNKYKDNKTANGHLFHKVLGFSILLHSIYLTLLKVYLVKNKTPRKKQNDPIKAKDKFFLQNFFNHFVERSLLYHFVGMLLMSMNALRTGMKDKVPPGHRVNGNLFLGYSLLLTFEKFYISYIN